MSAKYERLLSLMEEEYGEESARKRIEKAKLFWNPRNYDDGAPIKRSMGVPHLMDYYIKKHTGRNRFFFGFHDHSNETMSDANKVYRLLSTSKNWKTYMRLWQKVAPEDIANPRILLLALVEITTKGFKLEEKFVREQKALGREVRKSTVKEDLKGIDYWVDGKPVQVKSDGTMKKWVDPFA